MMANRRNQQDAEQQKEQMKRNCNQRSGWLSEHRQEERIESFLSPFDFSAQTICITHTEQPFL